MQISFREEQVPHSRAVQVLLLVFAKPALGVLSDEVQVRF